MKSFSKAVSFALFSMLLCAGTASATAVSPSAPRCTDGAVQVTADPTAQPNSTVPYSFKFCSDAGTDRYVESVKAAGTNAVVHTASHSLDGASAVTGDGAFVPAQTGSYWVAVAYYHSGQNEPAQSASTLVHVTEPATSGGTASGTTGGGSTGTPAGTTVAVIDDSGNVANPAGQATALPAARLQLSVSRKRTVSRTQKLTFTVRNVSRTTARNVQLRLNGKVRYLHTSQPLLLNGSKGCSDLGDLAPGLHRRLQVTVSGTTRALTKLRVSATATNTSVPAAL